MKTTNQTNLNKNEMNVLIACMNAIVNATGDEFGIVNEIKVEGITVNQLKGYLSQLQSKGFIDIFIGSKRDLQNNQVTLTFGGCAALKCIAPDDETIEIINRIESNI